MTQSPGQPSPDSQDAELERAAEEYARRKYQCFGEILDHNTEHGIADFLAGALKEAERAQEEISWLNQVLQIVASRVTDDPSHDWTTCSEPSCVLARETLAKYRGETP